MGGAEGWPDLVSAALPLPPVDLVHYLTTRSGPPRTARSPAGLRRERGACEGVEVGGAVPRGVATERM